MDKSSEYQLEKIPITPFLKKRFRSLRWKISLSSSLLLLVLMVMFCFISYLSLMANFDSQRDTDYRRYSREIDNLINNTSQNL